jgi:uncharacterized membrane protein affecting hemolysin expression
MALAWTSTSIEFRTLRAKFLALMVPFIVISTVIVFGLSEYTARRDAKQQLYAKLDALLEIQSAVLTEPLWNVADHQVELVLQAIAIDPDVLGAVVFDEKGEPSSSTKRVNPSPQSAKQMTWQRKSSSERRPSSLPQVANGRSLAV